MKKFKVTVTSEFEREYLVEATNAEEAMQYFEERAIIDEELDWLLDGTFYLEAEEVSCQRSSPE